MHLGFSLGLNKNFAGGASSSGPPVASEVARYEPLAEGGTILDGDRINTLVDLTGNGWDLTATGTERALFDATNGAVFQGGQAMRNRSNGVSGPFDAVVMHAVVRMNGLSDSNARFLALESDGGSDTGGQGAVMLSRNGSANEFEMIRYTRATAPAAAVSLDTTYLVTTIARTDDVELRINGQTIGTFLNIPNFNQVLFDEVHMGKRDGSGGAWYGDTLFTGMHADDTLATMEAYEGWLQAKYPGAFTLVAGHPFAPPAPPAPSVSLGLLGDAITAGATPAIPTETVAGSVLVASVMSGGDVTSFDDIPGWTKQGEVFGVGNLAASAVYYRVADGTEGATITVGTNVADASRLVTSIIAMEGVDTSSPFAAFSIDDQANGGNQNAWILGDITVPSAGQYRYSVVVGGWNLANTVTPPAGMTALHNGESTRVGGWGCIVYAAVQDDPPTGVNGGQFTATTALQYTCANLSFNPA